MRASILSRTSHWSPMRCLAITTALAEPGGRGSRTPAELDDVPEEQQRGITLTSSYVEVETARRRYIPIDYKGPVDIIKLVFGS